MLARARNVTAMKGLPTWRTGALLASSLGVMAAASVATHLAGPAEAEGVSEAAEHAAALLPPVLGPFLALALLGLVRLARGRSLGPGWYLLLPPLAFGLQELAERGVNTQMVEPGVLAAALVQVPFALLAYLFARLLRAAVVRVARFLSAPRSTPRVRVAPVTWPRSTRSIARVPALAGAHRGRAPPYLR
jgi:hypothetical protein